MTSERFVSALNAQIAREFAAAHQYLAIGAYYAGETFPQLTAFFYRQADEERDHAMRMVNYLIDRDAQPDIGGIEAPRTGFADHVEPIRLALEQERSVTVQISELFEIARETRDFQSEQFLQWFLAEQVEEENSGERMVERLRMAGDNRAALLILDREVAARSSAE